MTRIVRIRGDSAVYPAGACVSCLQPATTQVEIIKVKGQVVRKVRVPFCIECSALRRFKSARQVLFERIATANSLLMSVSVGVYTYTWLARADVSSALEEAAVAWALLLGALSTLVVFGAMYLLVEPWSRRFRSDATKAALEAVTISDFDWETTALAFRDGEYAEQFARANGVPTRP